MKLRSALPCWGLILTLFGCDVVANAEDGMRGGSRDRAPTAVTEIMSRHVEHASGLTVALATGDDRHAAAHLDAMLAEPTLAPLVTHDPRALDSVLPARVIDLDRRFRSVLSKLRTAVQSGDDELSAVQLGSMVQACRQCHRACAELRVAPPGP